MKKLALLAPIVAAALICPPATVSADNNRDIVEEYDEDNVSAVAITNRLERVNVILAKAQNRLGAVDAATSPPGDCFPIASYYPAPVPECAKQIAALDLAAVQSHALLASVASIDGGSGDSALARRLDRALLTSDAAESALAGIIGPEIPAGIIGPEIARVTGISLVPVAGAIATEVEIEAGIIGPEMPGIIGPERTADLAGIIGPELPAIIGPEREAALADLDTEIGRLERALIVAFATKRALEAQP